MGLALRGSAAGVGFVWKVYVEGLGWEPVCRLVRWTGYVSRPIARVLLAGKARGIKRTDNAMQTVGESLEASSSIMACMLLFPRLGSPLPANIAPAWSMA